MTEATEQEILIDMLSYRTFVFPLEIYPKYRKGQMYKIARCCVIYNKKNPQIT